ncbi:MAG: ArsA family ATPase [Candidatus Hadarchaeota archaeon]
MPKRKARLILCSGKGGVGKSTVASAIATYFSETGKKTLLVSSDPVQALSRIFNKKVGNKITKITKNLDAMEIDVEKIATKVETEYKDVLADALSSWLDEETAKSLPLHILSGADELLALDKIRRLVDDEHEVVVWDTSPTTHTLRLLGLSKKLSEAFHGKFAALYKLAHPLQAIRAAFGGPEPQLLKAVENLGRTVEKVEKMLADSQTELILVMNPEQLSIFEAKQLKEAAEAHHITVKRAVVNKMLLPCKCNFCTMKRKEQEENLDLIKQEYNDLKLLVMPFMPYEILREKRVREYARELFKD